MKNITIIGSGLVGSLLSIYMAKRHYNVNVYERRPDMRKQKVDAGRSINLALSDRGLKALHKVGLENEVRKMTIPMHGRMVHALDGTTNFQPYGKEGQFINSISRGGLNELLMNEAEKYTNTKLYFEHRSLEVDFKTNEIIIENSNPDSYRDKTQNSNSNTQIINHKSEIINTKSDLIFGTDGAFSAVRTSLTKTDRFNYSQDYLLHGYKELSIPPAANSKWQMEKNALHIWPRKSYMLIALPNLDGSFTVTLFLAFEGEYSFEHIQTAKDARAFFEKHFADALALMPHFDEEFFTNPSSSLATFRCYPWVYQHKICLLGDAAHGVVPFYGQGMNCGFEDCDVLDDLIDKHSEDWSIILPEFQQLRKPDAIANLALRNFIEMRDLVADENFLTRKKIEKAMHERHPEKFVPLYALVTFGHTRYSEAQRLGQLHDTFFSRQTNLKEIAATLHTPETQKALDAWVEEINTLS
jgi:kynurenine 3-monooxygenase